MKNKSVSCDLRVTHSKPKKKGGVMKFEINERQYVFACSDCLRVLVQRSIGVPDYDPYKE